MAKDCHRCGAALAPPESFCPNCGAPQLVYEPAEETLDGVIEANSSTARDIQWKQALGAAITFAVPVGLLCSSVIPVISSACCLWVIAGTVAAVGLYQRRVASRVLGRPVGIRIGTMIGIFSATIAAAFNAGALVLERYVLHNGDEMEKAFQISMEQGSLLAAQIYTAAPEQAKEAMKYWLSPDGRASATLLTVLMSSLGILAFSMIGGALATRIFSGRNPSPRSS